MRIIRVTGKGNLKVKPDTTRITLSLGKLYEEYGETLKKSSEDTEKIKDLLAGFGFERSDLKTLSFDIETEYEKYYDKCAYKQRFIGYRYYHLMKVEFDSDNERLGRILYALAHCSVNPEFRLSYTVKDAEASKNELLGKAVADAKDKAAVLSAAAGVKLKNIETIDYSWGHIDFEIQPMNRMLASETCCASMAGNSYDMDIEPDDIDVSDTVTVIWEIE